MTTERFVTLTGDDPRLGPHLMGCAGDRAGDEAIRPVLVSSLNPHLFRSQNGSAAGRGAVGRELCEWTFEYVPLKALRRPKLFKVWLLALRPETWVLSLAPMVSVLGLLPAASVDFSGAQVFSAIAGIIALHAAINLFDDFHDHMRGWDRVDSHGGARVLAQGWLKAGEVRALAWVLFLLSCLAGMYILFVRSAGPLSLVAVVAFLAGLEFAVSRFGLKYRGFAELAAWFMFGPLLTVGLNWALTGGWSVSALALGALFGSVALLSIHLKNFESILIDGQARLQTWPVRAGFDASKTFTVLCAGLVMFSFALVLVFVSPWPERLLAMVALVSGVGPLLGRVSRIKSPVAGEMRGLYREALRLAWLLFISIIVGDVIHFWGDQIVSAL